MSTSVCNAFIPLLCLVNSHSAFKVQGKLVLLHDHLLIPWVQLHYHFPTWLQIALPVQPSTSLWLFLILSFINAWPSPQAVSAFCVWISPPYSAWHIGTYWLNWIAHASSYMCFPDSSVGKKKSACNTGDSGSVPGLGTSAGEGIGYPLQYFWASLVAQLVKNPPAMRETWNQSLGWEDPLEKGKTTHSSILAWRIPWTV